MPGSLANSAPQFGTPGAQKLLEAQNNTSEKQVGPACLWKRFLINSRSACRIFDVPNYVSRPFLKKKESRTHEREGQAVKRRGRLSLRQASFCGFCMCFCMCFSRTPETMPLGLPQNFVCELPQPANEKTESQQPSGRPRICDDVARARVGPLRRHAVLGGSLADTHCKITKQTCLGAPLPKFSCRTT